MVARQLDPDVTIQIHAEAEAVGVVDTGAVGAAELQLR